MYWSSESNILLEDRSALELVPLLTRSSRQSGFKLSEKDKWVLLTPYFDTQRDL